MARTLIAGLIGILIGAVSTALAQFPRQPLLVQGASPLLFTGRMHLTGQFTHDGHQHYWGLVQQAGLEGCVAARFDTETRAVTVAHHGNCTEPPPGIQ